MARRSRSVRTMLSEAEATFDVRRRDGRFSKAQQRAIREARNLCSSVLASLDANSDPVDVGQRDTLYNDCRAKALELFALERASTLLPTELYGAIDKLDDAGMCIRRAIRNKSADMGD